MCPLDVERDPSASRPEPSDAPASQPTALKAYRLTVAYDGSAYFGWQRQPDQPTVQACLESALQEVTGESGVKAYASSRTDTGVHAIGQSVVFRSERWKAECDKLPFALNTKLPLDIVVREAVEVPLTFHPLRDSRGKRYRYTIYRSRKGDPINARTHWWIRRRLDLDAMRGAAEMLLGEHDFQSFESSGSPRSHTIRTVRQLEITSRPHMDGMLIDVSIEANGFLYNMVRNIVGTLVQVGVGRETPRWVLDVLAARDRRVAGATAPPQGLCLVEVLY